MYPKETSLIFLRGEEPTAKKQKVLDYTTRVKVSTVLKKGLVPIEFCVHSGLLYFFPMNQNKYFTLDLQGGSPNTTETDYLTNEPLSTQTNFVMDPLKQVLYFIGNQKTLLVLDLNEKRISK